MFFTKFVSFLLLLFIYYHIAFYTFLVSSVSQQAGYTRWGENFPETSNQKLCVQVRTKEEENIKAAWENKNCENNRMFICEVAAGKITLLISTFR